jgi:hypothetical protein
MTGDATPTLPLFLQQLSGPNQTLAILYMLALRRPNRAAATGELLALIDEIRLPRPKNPSSTLTRLQARGLVRRAGKLWQLTPEGERTVERMTALVDFSASTQDPRSVGSPFGSSEQDVVPYWYAPYVVQRAVRRVLDASPFDRNVLLITRYPRDSDPDDSLHEVIPAIDQALKLHGLALQLASDRNADDGLHGNVVAHMWAARYGIAILESRVGTGHNPNVLAELGAMAMTGRRCALLRDTTARDLPSDLLDRLYKPIDLDDVATVVAQVHRFVRDDLQLSQCVECPSRR